MTDAVQIKELLIIDPAVANASALLDGRRADMDVLHLAPDGHGFRQIADYLEGRHGIVALHILSHGEPGALLLAGEAVDRTVLDTLFLDLTRIAAALDPAATVLLYGCSVAAKTSGQRFVDHLEAILGVCVAAAAGPVGSATLGGGWALQSRTGLSVNLAFGAVTRASYASLLATDTLTGGADTPALSADDDTVTVDTDNALNAGDVIDGLAGTDTLAISGAQTVVLGATTLTNVEAITITAGIQNITTDDATVGAAQTLTVDAFASTSGLTWNGAAETDGTFSITGSTVADRLTGGAGNDTLHGGAGNDTLSGAQGNDLLYGNDNNDTLYGGDGLDTLSGGNGNDFMYAGIDDDVLYGDAGNDGMSGDAGNDTLFGGDGNDTLIGGAGNDVFSGGEGNDWLWGQDDNDTLYGAAGNDTLSGNAGNDVLYGDDGNDTLSGGSGNDTLFGGAGNDVVSASATDFNGDTISDFAVGDSIDVVGTDLSALNGTVAAGTISLGGGQTLTLTGITAASGTFAATFSGGKTTITLVPNVAPDITSDDGGATADVSTAENQTTVTTVTATDDDNDPLTFSITGGADQTKFSIDANSGALSFASAPDFEAPADSDTNNTYVVQITASDGNGGTADQTITVTVTDVNDALPVITSDGGGATAAVSTAENQTTVTTVTATDDDNDPLTFSITGGADQAKFSIDANSGALSFASAPNFEAPADSDTNNTYVVQVTASDGNGGTTNQTITVTVTNVNEAPPPAPTPPAPPPPPVLTTTVDGVSVQSQTTTDGQTGLPVQEITVPVTTATRVDDSTTANASLADISLGLPNTPTLTGGQLTMSLPTGTGLTATGATTTLTSSQGMLDLINRIEQQTTASSNARSEMTSAGSDFIQGLGDRPMLTRTVMPTVATSGSSAPAGPVTIMVTGGTESVLTGSSSTSAAISLIIDTRQLPSGSTITLNNVEFAAIIGSATITGGGGENYVVGDDASQYIMLGAGDDILSGGGGDDIVGSTGGNDRISGGSGNDSLFGGIGNDNLSGGSGNDLVTGGRSDKGEWVFYLDSSGAITGQHQTALGIDPAARETFKAEELDASQDGLGFITAGPGIVKQMALLYDAAFARPADLAGLSYWAAQSLTFTQVAQEFLNSPEWAALYGKQDDLAFVTSLYQIALGRAPEPEALAYWLATLTSGAASRAEVLAGFALSTENEAQAMSDDGIRLGSIVIDTEAGWIKDSGDDRLDGGAGSDTLVGGDGTDAVVYANDISNYRFVLKATGEFGIVDTVGGDTDVIQGVELGEFAGQAQTLGFTQLDANIVRTVGLLYQSAFDRPSDLDGLVYWTGQGLSAAQYAANFAGSSEFELRYGALDDRDFVKELYQNAFSRKSGTEEIAHWTGYLDDHTRAELLGTWIQQTEVIAAQYDSAGLWLV